jgi:pSer/pThr/pTyr-binding forkhead associated (FHA) protein
MIKLQIFEDLNLYFEENYSEPRELVVGRGSTSDIVLEGHPGISRSHLKITIKESTVEVELLSASGRLIQNSQNIKDAVLDGGEHTVSIPPYDFKFNIPKAAQEIELESSAEESEVEEDSLSVQSEEQAMIPTGFDEDEKTKTAAAAPLDYSVKVFKGSRLLQELALDGDSWDFGRDQACHYTIKSKKTSRKHFTILNSRNKFYVKDLGSSNGTFLNNQQLPSNQEIEVKSGDYIEVAEFKFIFEIKDNSFENKLKDVALLEQYGSEEDVNSLQEIGELRENALAISDEFLKLPEKDRIELTSQKKKKNYLRPALLILIIVMCGGYYFMDSGNQLDEAELAAIAAEKRMQREKVNAAIDRFNLALRFYNESQFERCIFEIDEFLKYDIQTEETAGAAELKNQCDIEKERLQRKRDLEIQEQKRREIAAQVEALIQECTPIAEEGAEELKRCIEPIFGLDPSNEKASALLDRAEAVDMKRQQEQADAAKYKKNVASGRYLYRKAEDYDKYGDWKRALKAYDKHVKSGYPDPAKLKSKSRRNIAAINTRIDSTLQGAISASEKYLAEDDFKNAVLETDKGLEVNRDHPKLLSIKATAERNLKMILRKYYQESVIEEDFGQIDEAKIKWKKILEQGVPDSDYYRKAKLKLRYYEEGY